VGVEAQLNEYSKLGPYEIYDLDIEAVQKALQLGKSEPILNISNTTF